PGFRCQVSGLSKTQSPREPGFRCQVSGLSKTQSVGDQPLTGRSIFEGLAVSLKRYPDTKRVETGQAPSLSISFASANGALARLTPRRSQSLLKNKMAPLVRRLSTMLR